MLDAAHGEGVRARIANLREESRRTEIQMAGIGTA